MLKLIVGRLDILTDAYTRAWGRAEGGCGRGNWFLLGADCTKLIVDYRFCVAIPLLCKYICHKGTVEWLVQAIVPNLVPNVLL